MYKFFFSESNAEKGQVRTAFRFHSFRFISVSFEMGCVLSCLARILMWEVPIKTFSN